MKVKMIGGIAFLVMISFFGGGVYAGGSPTAYDGPELTANANTSTNNWTVGNNDVSPVFSLQEIQENQTAELQRGNAGVIPSQLDIDDPIKKQDQQNIANYQKEVAKQEVAKQEAQMSPNVDTNALETSKGSFISYFENEKHVFENTTDKEKVNSGAINILSGIRALYKDAEKAYKEQMKNIKDPESICFEKAENVRNQCIDELVKEWKGLHGDKRKTKKQAYQNQAEQCRQDYSNQKICDDKYHYSEARKTLQEVFDQVQDEKNKAEQLVEIAKKTRKQQIDRHCDDYKAESTVYNEEDKQTALYIQNKQKCDKLNDDYQKMIKKIEEGKVVDPIEAQGGVHFELTDSPREMLDIVVYKANSDMQIQETAMDGITSHGTAANCPANAGRITRTLCWIKENIHPYIQWIVYAGLSLSILLLIRNGFLLVTNTVHGSAPDIKKRILYIGVGIVILTGFYYLIDLFMIVFAFIFD